MRIPGRYDANVMDTSHTAPASAATRSRCGTGTSLAEGLRASVTSLMRATGQTQSDIALALGVDQTQVSRRQTGRAAWSLDDCDRLAAHFGIGVLDLLAGPERACARLPRTRGRGRGQGVRA
jgi:antitoxin component HigA of HigAB toxin-antitoxin module